jgi:hypothetical protein
MTDSVGRPEKYLYQIIQGTIANNSNHQGDAK